MYKSRRRPWVKLYCREWLTSTVRLNLTEQDRSRFIDLLAMAGDSKVPGVVCAGYESGSIVGYPLDYLASMMRCTIKELRKTLDKLAKSDRVTISQTKSDLVEMTSKDSNPVIRITGWHKYQSEYLRQIESLNKNRNLQTSSQLSSQTKASSLQSPHTEVEGEGEVEEEKKEAPAAPGIVPVALWLSFVEMRRKNRKPLTDHAGELIRRELLKLQEQGHDPVEVLEQSIRNGWQDVFPIREGQNGTRQSIAKGKPGKLERYEQAAKNVTGRGSELAKTLRGDALHAGRARNNGGSNPVLLGLPGPAAESRGAAPSVPVVPGSPEVSAATPGDSGGLRSGSREDERGNKTT